MPRVDEYASTSALDPDDTILSLVDGALKNVPLPSARGYYDASHYADLAATVLNTAESTTGWASTDSWDSAQPILDTTNKTTGTASVRNYMWLGFTGTFYVNLASDTSVSTYSHVAFDLWWDTAAAATPPTQFTNAVVATAVALGGTTQTVAGVRVAGQTLTPWTTFYTIYIPLTGLTSIRSIGLQSTGTGGTNSRSFMNIDNVRFAAATGLDQAIHAAGTSGQVVIPPSYTTALTQHPLINKPAGVTVIDQRAA